MAHSAITRRKGKDYAPDVHELQAWIDEYLKKNTSEESLGEGLDSKGVITCDNPKCGHNWELVDGGDDPYLCHKCGHKNKPTEDVDEVKYIKPNFEYEWEEAIRYPEFKEMGFDNWLKIAENGHVVNFSEIKDRLGNVDLDFDGLDKDKKARFIKALESDQIELPIAVKFSENDYDLVGGNTRLSGLTKNGIDPKIWVVDLSKPIDEAKKTDFSKEKKSGLHGWFSRRGGDGNKGWVDCNTCKKVDGRKKCKACGRQKGEKRSKYPSCRPTPASCGTPGKGKKWGKTKNESIHEQISASEAHRDEGAIQTVIDNKRDLGFITIKHATVTPEYFWGVIKKHNLKVIPVKGNPSEAYIYYRPEAEEKAIELAEIANKYGGYLSYKATKEETRRIGELLGYRQEDINDYITDKYEMNEAKKTETNSVKRVALLFIVVDNKVLLFKRSAKESTNPSKYGMLGGGIEKGESPQNALKREVEEEAGVTLTSFKPLKKYKYDGVELNVFYTNTFPVDKIELDKKEHTSHKFFTLEDVMEMADKEMIQSNKKIARDYNKKVSNKKQLQENLNEEITKIKKMMGLNEEPEVITWGDVSKLLSTIKDKQNKDSAMTALKGFGKLGASLLPGIDFISNAVEVIDNLGDTAEAAKALMGISKNVSQNTLKSPNDSKLKQLTGPFWDALKLTPELSIMLDDKIETDFINQVIVPKISSGGNENEPLPNMDVELGKWLNSRGLRDKSDVFFTGKSGNINEETFFGNHIWQHIVDITPNEDDIPWGFKKKIKQADFNVDNNFDLESLLNTDPDFKEYYESGDERYGEDDDMDESDLYHDIVVVDGELLDGYSRAATLLRNGETRTSAFVGTNKM
jgi:8-oxo-dGTP pyrophosphatase MutT (NUDIX family)